MYCSIDEAWNNKNSIANLSKRYQENFNDNTDNELDKYKINDNDLIQTKKEEQIFVPRQDERQNTRQDERKDARYNKAPDTVYNNNMLNDSEDLKTEDIMLSTEEPLFTIPTKPSLKKKDKECKDLVNKVLSCPTCRKLIENKLNKNPLQNFINGEVREILILILIGLIIMILIDLFIRISK
jgi:hypothetical protein